MRRRYFRIVANRPAKLMDFESQFDLGNTLLNPTPERVEMWRGISIFATLQQAMNLIRRFPAKGSFIAVLELDDDLVRIERTGATRGHFTVWAEREVLLASVVDVSSVEFHEMDISTKGGSE